MLTRREFDFRWLFLALIAAFIVIAIGRVAPSINLPLADSTEYVEVSEDAAFTPRMAVVEQPYVREEIYVPSRYWADATFSEGAAFTPRAAVVEQPYMREQIYVPSRNWADAAFSEGAAFTPRAAVVEQPYTNEQIYVPSRSWDEIVGVGRVDETAVFPTAAPAIVDPQMAMVDNIRETSRNWADYEVANVPAWAGERIGEVSRNWVDFEAVNPPAWAGERIGEASRNWADYEAAAATIWAGQHIREISRNYADFE